MLKRTLALAMVLWASMMLTTQPTSYAQSTLTSILPAQAVHHGPRPQVLAEAYLQQQEVSITVRATSYCLPGHTATGAPVGVGTVAVDPSVIPLGSTVYIPGYGMAVADDTGGGIQGNRIDVWLPPTHGCAASWAWGVRTVQVEVVMANADSA